MASIFLDYLYWHFTIAPFGILGIMSNYLKATWHRFLIVQHLQTLFAPWHRQNPSDIGRRERTFTDKILDKLVDFYIRIIAALVRLTVIAIGLVTQVIIAIGFCLLFVIWLGWPAIAVYLIGKGIFYVF